MSIVKDLLSGMVSVLCYCLYRVAGSILHLVQTLTRPRVDGYHNSCRLSTIIWRRKLFLIDVVTPNDFLGINEILVHPNYVLQRNVSLYCVSRNEAIFVETPDTVDIYSSKVSPFQYIGQFHHATKVIRMPISYFHKTAAFLDKPRVTVGYLANTGRCGSTILAQAVEQVPGTLVHAEPDCLTNVCIMKRDKTVTSAERKRILVSCIKVLCKPMFGVTRICIKTRSCASAHMLTLAEEFPEIKIMFGYRSCSATVSSFLGLMISETVQSLSLYVIDNDLASKALPYLRRKMHHYFVRAFDQEPPLVAREDMNSVELFTYMWSCCMVLVRDLKTRGGDVLPLLYEDLVQDSRTELAKVFCLLGINHSHLDAALGVFKADSQENSPLRQSNIQNMQRRRISDDNMMKADRILQLFGLPRLDQEYRL